jgi:hypothetical protein
MQIEGHEVQEHYVSMDDNCGLGQRSISIIPVMIQEGAKIGLRFEFFKKITALDLCDNDLCDDDQGCGPQYVTIHCDPDYLFVIYFCDTIPDLGDFWKNVDAATKSQDLETRNYKEEPVMEKESLLMFNLFQNVNGEYPDLIPYQVIEFVDQDHPAKRGYSSCDEYGRTSFLPGLIHKEDACLFLPANDDTEWAFIGEKVELDKKTWLVVKHDPSIEENNKELIDR